MYYLDDKDCIVGNKASNRTDSLKFNTRTAELVLTIPYDLTIIKGYVRHQHNTFRAIIQTKLLYVLRICRSQPMSLFQLLLVIRITGVGTEQRSYKRKQIMFKMYI